MKRTIDDPEVQALAAIAGTIAPDYARAADDPWNGSPFQWILGLPSRSRGAVGEALVAGWSAAKGFDVMRSPNSQADRIIAGKRVEVKFSTLWKSGGFKFQQIRDQDYDYCFCLGLSPFDAQAWLLPKDVLYQYVIGHMGQHTGADTGRRGVRLAGPSDQWQPGSHRRGAYCGRGGGRFKRLKVGFLESSHGGWPV